MIKTIIALGGASFRGTDRILERYILAQSKKEKPSVLFIPTASGDAAAYIADFYDAFSQFSCTPAHLSLFTIPKGLDLETYILSFDVIFVGGGNTRNLLCLWQLWGVDLILRKAWEKGIILAGSSAGSLCWFRAGITDSFPEGLMVLPCMGFLPLSNCPHYNDEAGRRPVYHAAMVAGKIGTGIAQDQYVGLHFRGEELYKVVSSKQDQNAYHVSYDGGILKEIIIAAEKLG